MELLSTRFGGPTYAAAGTRLELAAPRCGIGSRRGQGSDIRKGAIIGAKLLLRFVVQFARSPAQVSATLEITTWDEDDNPCTFREEVGGELGLEGEIVVPVRWGLCDVKLVLERVDLTGGESMSGQVHVIDEGVTPLQTLQLPGPAANGDPDPRHTFAELCP